MRNINRETITRHKKINDLDFSITATKKDNLIDFVIFLESHIEQIRSRTGSLSNLEIEVEQVFLTFLKDNIYKYKE